MNRNFALFAFLALVRPAVAQDVPPVPEVVAPELPGIVITPPKAEYRDLDATLALLDKWCEARPEAASLLDLGTSSGGLPVRAIVIAGPGPLPAAERKTLALIGGLDGVSLHGAEEVLGIAAGLAANPEALPADLAFLCLPWASPDGLSAEYARVAGSGWGQLGRDGTEVDDDLDGASAEDGPDDLDGDGRVTMMLVEDPEGAWRRAADARFLVPASSDHTDGQRYSLWREGEDDDLDGRFNEDGPGGVRVDRNFPFGWHGPFAADSPGALPLTAGAALALAELARGGSLVGALFFDGHAGRVEVSTGFELDALAKLGASLFGLPLASRAPEGAALDWLPRIGVPALRTSFWGPELGLGRGLVKAASFRSDELVPPADMLEDFNDPSSAAARGGGWRRFLDERRGGIGFVDWHPVDLADGTCALVGGWEAAVLNNPPVEQLARSVTLAMDLVGGLISALPDVRVEVLEASRAGELCTLVARLSTSTKSASALPVEFLAPGGLELVLDLPPGARLIAGPAREAIHTADIGGGSIDWLIFAPLDALIGLRVVRAADGVELTRREVRP